MLFRIEPQADATVEEPDANTQRPGRRSASSRPGGRAGCRLPARRHPAGDPPAAGQGAEPAAGSPLASIRLDAWHGDLVARLDRLGWLRSLSDGLIAVLGPARERHQDNLVLELMHGGRWVGHPIHPALSDLPIGLWTGVMGLDAVDRGPAAHVGRNK